MDQGLSLGLHLAYAADRGRSSAASRPTTTLEGLTMNDVSAPDGLVPTAGATRRHLLAGLGGAGFLAAGLATMAAPAPPQAPRRRRA
jgi:hypothetical protein